MDTMSKKENQRKNGPSGVIRPIDENGNDKTVATDHQKGNSLLCNEKSFQNGSLVTISTRTKKIPPQTQSYPNFHLKNEETYKALYDRSIRDSKKFWLEQAESLNWFQFPTIACKYNWNTAEKKIHHTWFEDGFLNIAYNCLDRHLTTQRKDKIAIYWQGDDPNEKKSLTYQELHREVSKFANVLKSQGIGKGDRICIYLPMIPEAAIAMLASARIGAIHSVVFGGFSSEALAYRIQDSDSKLLLTANVALRGGKIIPLKEMADEAVHQSPSIQSVIVIQRTKAPCNMGKNDFWYHEAMANQPEECIAETLNAEDPLCILYTSGSTGKPKGIVHTQAGYLLYVSLTHKYVFDIREDDIYWCTADVGWVTGHSYVVYGPLANGSTTLMFEGIPTYPDAGRFWEIVDHYKVNVLYTAPTAIRTLIAKGDTYPEKYDLSSLRVLGTVGEPINPEAWEWFYDKIGHGKCAIVDTWWQTETGGILITPLPGINTLKPGSASRPFLGIEPVIIKEDSSEGGALCMNRPWPGMMRTIWRDEERFIETYFSAYPNHYFSGDGCRVDEENDYWLLGRMDDVVNVSGHRIGTAEVESAFVSHRMVAEAAVVPIHDPIKGQALHAYVILKESAEKSEKLKAELLLHIRKEIGPIAVPKYLQFSEDLPKTRSGKIMRRILRKIANGDAQQLGDTSTLSNPDIIRSLLEKSIQH